MEAKGKYAVIAEKDSILPKLSETGNPESIEYCNYNAKFYIFPYKSNTLICKYEEQDYIEQKKRLEKQYVFEQEKILIDINNCDPVVQIDDYTFRFLSTDEYDIYFPKNAYLVATNDITREIVYIFYCDYEHDYIGSAVDFINDDCGWEHIR